MTTRDDERPLSIEEVLELPDDSWVNGGFTGVVLNIETVPMKKGGKFWKVLVGSETGNAQFPMSLFAAPRFTMGALIEVSGQGIKRSSFQGQPQVSVGAKGMVNIIRQGGATGAPVRDQQQRPAAPPDRSAAPQSHSADPAGDAAERAAVEMIPGVTVGHAMTHALALVKEAYMQGEPNLIPPRLSSVLGNPSFWGQVMDTASDIIRISNSLQKGKIRPTLRDRLNPPKVEAPPPPKEPTPPPPVRKARPPKGEEDFDSSGSPEDSSIPF